MKLKHIHYGANLASIHSFEQEEDIEYIFNEIDGSRTWIWSDDSDNNHIWVYVG